MTFKDTRGVVKPALQIVQDHSDNWVRVRLMVALDGRYGLFQDLPYVKAIMKDARARGLKVLLDLPRAGGQTPATGGPPPAGPGRT